MFYNGIGARVYDDYSDFMNDPYDVDERNRVIKHHKYRVEEVLPIPKELADVVDTYLQTTTQFSELQLAKKKVGRPSSSVNKFLRMLVWYRCNLDPRLKDQREKGISLYEQVALSIAQRDSESCAAAVLGGGIDDICRLDSESSVRRANKWFKEYGFSWDGENLCLHDEHLLEAFIMMVLKEGEVMGCETSSSQKIVDNEVYHRRLYDRQREILDFWRANVDKSQGQ